MSAVQSPCVLALLWVPSTLRLLPDGGPSEDETHILLSAESPAERAPIEVILSSILSTKYAFRF